MLVQIEDDDEKVALQALEFWLALAQKSFCKDILSNPLLERLLESLVNRLRLTKKEIGRLNRDSEDENGLFLNFAFSEWSSSKHSLSFNS